VAALIASVEHRQPFDESDLATLMQGLGRYLRARFRTLTRDEVVECVNEALARFIAAVGAGRIDPTRRPAAYLTRTTERVALDEVRRRSAEALETIEVEELPAEEAPLEALLDALAGRDAVLELMTRARDRGEHELINLIRAWLNAAQPGKVPTQRELGATLGISHTEVGRRMVRLQELLRERG
jgi:RNA polymerase sigma factor (sigma-70 family)